MDILQTFRIVATEFADIPDDTVYDENEKVVQYGINDFIELYKDQISEERFGSLYNKAVAFLVAHKLKMAGYGDLSNGSIGDSMRVNSYSEGETSISYATSSVLGQKGDAEYLLTSYGLEFLNLRDMVIIPITSAGEGGIYGRDD